MKSTKKRSHKKSQAKHSAKRSQDKTRKRPSRTEYNIPNSVKLFYDMTVKRLSTDHKAVLNVKDKSILYGQATKTELEQMPWMFGVNPIWSSVPEPYEFQIHFSQNGKGEEIKKALFILNGNAVLVKNVQVGKF